MDNKELFRIGEVDCECLLENVKQSGIWEEKL